MASDTHTHTCRFPSPLLSNQRRVRPLLGESEIKQITEAEGSTCQTALCWICPCGYKKLHVLARLANFSKLVCVHACENFNNGGEISPSSKTSLIVGIKVLSVYSITGVSANRKIRGEILPEGLPPYLFSPCVASQRRSRD